MKKKQDNKLIIAGLILVVLLAIIAFSTRDKKENNLDYEKMNETEIQVVMQENIESLEIQELAKLGERDRIQRYVFNFMKAVESKKYQTAYDMLYDEFKSNYFPTLEDFSTYAKTKFPRMFNIKYTNVERNGEIYVLWTEITDALGSSSFVIEMNFVVQENELNDYVMSFSVN